MKQIFNDSSQVAKCLNYQFDLNKDKISSFDSQQIYLSRYKMDYKTPKMTKKFNSSKNIESYECKCDCGKCHDINVDSYIQKTSSFTANKMADYKFESNKSNNSLIKCIKNTQKSNDIDFNVPYKLDLSKKFKVINHKNDKTSKTSIKTSETYDINRANKKPVVKSNKTMLRPVKAKSVCIEKHTIKPKKNKWFEKCLNVNQQAKKNEKNNKSNKLSCSSLSDLRVNSNNFYDEKSSHKSASQSSDLETSRKGSIYSSKGCTCNELKKSEVSKLKAKKCNDNKIEEEKVDTNRKLNKTNNSISKAFFVQNLDSQTESNKTKKINICSHISLVCDKCVEFVNLNNYRLYRFDLVDNS